MLSEVQNPVARIGISRPPPITGFGVAPGFVCQSDSPIFRPSLNLMVVSEICLRVGVVAHKG